MVDYNQTETPKNTGPLELDLTGLKPRQNLDETIEEGLYAVRVVETPYPKQAAWGDQIVWVFEIIAPTEPGKDRFVGRRLFHSTNFQSDPDPKKDTRRQTLRVVEALEVPIEYGSNNTFDSLVDRRCGVVVVNKEDRKDPDKLWANVKNVMTLKQFAAEMKKVREKYARLRELLRSAEIEEDTSGDDA